MDEQFVVDIVMIIAAGFLGGVLAKISRQPIILGYIIAGIIIGPKTGGYIVHEIKNVETLAEIGVALLLFSVGIEFSIKDLKPIRRIAGAGAIIQVILTLILGFIIGKAFGWTPLACFTLGISIISSSTAVILKSLVTTGHVSSLSGRVMLGMSIVQDVIVLPLMIVLVSLKDAKGGFLSVLEPVFMVVLFVGLMFAFGSKIIPLILKFVAKLKSQEIFLLAVISISLGIGYISYLFGLSFSFGAFVAGLVLAGSDYAHKALSEMSPVRDIFSLMFFVSVGMLLDPRFIVSNFGQILLLVSVACFGRGIILSLMCKVFHYRNVIPYAAFFGMLPISEMGFVVISSSQGAGIITEEQYSYILNMIVISMLIGPPISLCTGPVYAWARKTFKPKKSSSITLSNTGLRNHVILAGGGEQSRFIGRSLELLHVPYMIIEPNHQSFLVSQLEKYHVLFGEPQQRLILKAAGVDDARIVLLSIKEPAGIKAVVNVIREIRTDLRIIVQCEGFDGKEILSDFEENDLVQTEYEVGVEMLRRSLLSLDLHGSLVEEQIAQIGPEMIHQSNEDIKVLQKSRGQPQEEE